MSESAELSQQAFALQALLASQHTLLLSTASANGNPDISYAPFVRDENHCFYILISELAAHTGNLWSTPHASAYYSPGTESNNLFARERAIFDCNAQIIGRNVDGYSTQLKALQRQFGDIVGKEL